MKKLQGRPPAGQAACPKCRRGDPGHDPDVCAWLDLTAGRPEDDPGAREAKRSSGSPTPGQAAAVRKMTGFPAEKFGLRDRGLIRPGLPADLIAFDPATILDRATYEEPEQSPAGLPHVLVNGVFAVRDGVYTGAWAGRVLLVK